MCAWAALCSGTASAATINVSNTGDENAAATDNGICTLRETISAVNTNATVDSCVHNGVLETDTINLAAGSYALALDGTNEDGNANGDLDVNLAGGPLAIDGPDGGGTATITIQSGDPPERILASPTASTDTLTLKDLVITGGNSTADGVGGGVIVFGLNNGLTIDHSAITNNIASNAGGGIYFGGGGGELTVTNSIIRNNQASGSGGVVQGGGIRASGQMTVSKSLIADNTITSSSANGGHVASGGGIHGDFEDSSEELVIRNSSIVNNHAVVSTPTLPAAHAQGGGVSSFSIVEITNSTFSGNTAASIAEARGAGLAFQIAVVGTHSIFHATFDDNNASGGSATIGEALAASGAGSVVAGGNVFTGPNFVETCERYSPNVAFTLDTDAGGNLDDGTSCDLDSAADENQDPNLLALVPAGALSPVNDTAGPPGAAESLPVQRPPAGSVAIDHASFPADCVDAEELPSTLMADQRGFPRPKDGDQDSVADCDAGAVEVDPPPPTTPGGGTSTSPATQPTGLRAAALKKCAKIKSKRKKKRCKKRARRLPV